MKIVVIGSLLLGLLTFGYSAHVPVEEKKTLDTTTSVNGMMEDKTVMSVPMATESMIGSKNEMTDDKSMESVNMESKGEVQMADKINDTNNTENVNMEKEMNDTKIENETKEETTEMFMGRSAAGFAPLTAMDVMKKIYSECLQLGSFSCVKPKVLSFLSHAAKKDKILITDDLSIEKIRKFEPDSIQFQDDSTMEAGEVLERIDDFLANRELRMRLPKEITSGSLLPLVPKFLLKNIPQEIRMPLAERSHAVQERGFIKRVVVPFILGLKFKATAMIPLALALIALKTWKALTLGLLSLVLSGALIIFRFTKPKVVNYEVYHYPHAAPVVEHPVATPYDHHGYGRDIDAHDIAYNAYTRD